VQKVSAVGVWPLQKIGQKLTFGTLHGSAMASARQSWAIATFVSSQSRPRRERPRSADSARRSSTNPGQPTDARDLGPRGLEELRWLRAQRPVRWRPLYAPPTLASRPQWRARRLRATRESTLDLAPLLAQQARQVRVASTVSRRSSR
jgi:hypothetical protein